MQLDPFEHARVAEFVQRLSRENAHDLVLRAEPLSGGLTARSVYRVKARYFDEFGKLRLFRFVVKHVEGSGEREARVYEALRETKLGSLTPAVLGVARADGAPTHLYLEAVPHEIRWPWKRLPLVTRLLERLSHVHAPEHVRSLRRHVSDWDYAAELRTTARATLDLAERADLSAVHGRGALRVLRRLAEDLERIRRQVLGLSLLPVAVLHGDVHPGNVIVRWHAGGIEPVLIDWARARCGSPLEDVASWLQTLGFWEPDVRRRHDTLLAAYLRARGLSARPSRELREAYWLAAAMNCFGGALKYHLEIASATRVGRKLRSTAQHAIAHHLHLARRADACWRGGT